MSKAKSIYYSWKANLSKRDNEYLTGLERQLESRYPEEYWSDHDYIGLAAEYEDWKKIQMKHELHELGGLYHERHHLRYITILQGEG